MFRLFRKPKLLTTKQQTLQHPDLNAFHAPSSIFSRDLVVHLVNHFQAKNVAEIGVWKGHLSRKLLTECNLDHLWLVDPLEIDRNLFVIESKGPHPSMMEPGVYNCRMGEHTLTQPELDEVYQGMVNEFHREHPGKTTFHRMPSVKAAPLIEDGSLDFVFIDAIHLYEDVLADIAAWLPKLKPDGILAGDDYCDGFKGVIQAVNETFPEPIRKTHLPTGIWYIWKRDLK